MQILTTQIGESYKGLTAHCFAVDRENFDDTQQGRLADARLRVVIYSNDMTASFENGAEPDWASSLDKYLVYAPNIQKGGKHRAQLNRLNARPNYVVYEDWNDFLRGLSAVYGQLRPEIETRDKTQKVREMLEAKLDADLLAYLRFSHWKRTVVAVDNLDRADQTYDQTPAGEFNVIGGMMRRLKRTPDEQRAIYVHVIDKLLDRMGELNDAVAECGQGDLVRVVYDVAEGAIYVYETKRGWYLAGVTANQFKVMECDQTMAALTDSINHTW